MRPRVNRTEQLLEKPGGVYRGLDATGSRMSRRELLRHSSSTAVVTAIGMAGLLDLLESREAVAAGMVIAIVGVTREPIVEMGEPPETPHRHTFSLRFQVGTPVTPTSFPGTVFGRTERVISTGTVPEDEHWHIIPMTSTSLESLVSTGPENGESGEHVHQLSVE
jgi:hypothetical protein